MVRTRVTVSNVIKSRYYDCIEINLDGEKTQIVFDKSANVEQYNGKDIYLSKAIGADYVIEGIIDDNSNESIVDGIEEENLRSEIEVG